MKPAYAFFALLIAFSGCDSQSNMRSEKAKSEEDSRIKNGLSGQSSPYLLQHQYNPVDWQPWGDAAFEQAKAENKLVLISIGYSSCHWCHVMEHESFEDDSVAKVMNAHFVSIKVDREERPDVDQVYMNAVQLMTGGGGWPLNCFALPDGRPIYGGTYFKKEQWLDLLGQLQNTWEKDPDEVEGYSEQLTEGIRQSDLVTVNADEPVFSKDLMVQTVDTWKTRLDYREGGPDRSPKFPLPNNYLFLHRYGYLAEDEKVLNQVYLTLDKMAHGGIYDQIRGGFARYSTDAIWKAPHFEKMLYDNAQLLSLYSEAYQATKKELYREVVYETYDWLTAEMMSDENLFYSALDADSEGEEGKFYVWTKNELQEVLGNDFDFAAELYNVNAKGRWEHENYILLRDEDDDEVRDKLGLSSADFSASKTRVHQKLLARRAERIRPGLDDKILTSWNGLLISGLVDAAMAFDDDKFQDKALVLGEELWKRVRGADGALRHTYKEGKASINGYLEDYSFLAQGYISLYQSTLDELWLERATELTEYAIAHFTDEDTGMFFFTSDEDPPLITRKMEIDDNVIPASNSSMAHVLHTLGTYYYKDEWIERSLQMLNNVKSSIPQYGGGYSNWAMLALHEAYPYYEVAVMGESPQEDIRALSQEYIPNKLFMGASDEDAQLPLLEYKYVKGETMIYVCVEKSCKLPVSTVQEALNQMD